MKKRILAGAAVAGLIALSTTSAAYAAQTRTLPEGQHLYAIDCENNFGQLGLVDETTAEVTFVGDGFGSDIDCAADSAWDPNTNIAYFSTWNNGDEPLYSVDVATGVVTYIADLHDSNDDVLDDIYGFMMGTDGVLYGLGSAGGGSVILFTVDLATAEYTVVDDLSFEGSPWANGSFWSTSYNPADGNYYFLDGTELYTVDVATAEASYVGDQGDGVRTWGIAFDSNGVLWSTGTDNVTSATVDGWTTSGNLEMSDDATYINGDTGNTWYSESNFVTYSVTPAPEAAPELANTGASIFGTAGLMVALVAAGGAFVVARKRNA